MFYNTKNASFISKNLAIILVFLIKIVLSKVDIIYPISFAVVRHSSISVNLTTYMNNIGFPSTDQNGYNIGYNIIALDGYKAGMTISSVANQLSPLGTWVGVYSRILGNSRNLYGKTSADVQMYIKNEFKKRGSKIIMNAYSFQRPISEKNANPTDQGNNLAQFVNMYNFDGVSIDFDDFNSVKDKNASQWLTTMLKTLRKQLGKDKLIILQIYPTVLTQLAIFRTSLINSLVDIFVVKYFNLLKENYNTFENLFNRALVYNGTALWEMQKSTTIKIDICKTIIAKPSSTSGTWNSDSYVPASNLGTFFQQARIQHSWFGGYANLDFGSDPNGDFQIATLNSLRTYCNRSQTCFCF